MEACTNTAISTLPFVLLKTHVKMMVMAMAKMQNFTIARGLLPPDDSAQVGTINSGRCHNPHSSPRIILPTKGPCSGCMRGSAKPRQPISSPSGPPRTATKTKVTRVRTHLPSQKMTVEAMQMALKNVWAQRS